MKEYSGYEKKHLRALAHHLTPLIQIGKLGVTDQLIAAINKALDDHELIKVKFLGFKDEKDSLSEKIALSCNAIIPGLIGNVLILFRQNPVKENRKIIIPKR